MKKLLAVFSHPDDETFLCGGTIAKYASQGAEVHVVCATKGELAKRMGNPPFATRETLPEIREQELRAACGILGVRLVEVLGLKDQGVADETERVTQEVASRMRSGTPNAVVTFAKASGFANHPDHRAVAEAVMAAVEQVRRDGFDIPVFGVCGRGEAAHPEDLEARPDQIVRVDVLPFARQKLYAFRAHRTQTETERRFWDDDDRILPYMGLPECYVQLGGRFRPHKNEIL